MANRNDDYENRYDRQRDGYRDSRYQSEQFQSDSASQYGDSRTREGSYRDTYSPSRYDTDRSDSARYDSGANRQGSYADRGRSGGYDPLGDYDRAGQSYRQDSSSRFTGEHRSFRPDDFGGEDYSRGGYGSNAGYGSSGTRASQMSGYGSSSSYDSRSDRGFFAKAGDEVASWFGDDDAARRREMDHRGRGPAGYKRSDERLLEEACDRLTNDPRVDASNVTVTVMNGEVTLDGTVDSRQAKRRAEDCVDDIGGVGHVQNNLRVATSGTNTGTASGWGRTDATTVTNTES